MGAAFASENQYHDDFELAAAEFGSGRDKKLTCETEERARVKEASMATCVPVARAGASSRFINMC